MKSIQFLTDKKQLVGILDSEGIFASVYWTKDKILKNSPIHKKNEANHANLERNFILRNQVSGKIMEPRWEPNGLALPEHSAKHSKKFEWHVGNSPSRMLWIT